MTDLVSENMKESIRAFSEGENYKPKPKEKVDRKNATSKPYWPRLIKDKEMMMADRQSMEKYKPTRVPYKKK